MSIAVQGVGISLSEFDLIEIGKRAERVLGLQEKMTCEQESCPDGNEEGCVEGAACRLLTQISADVDRLVEEIRAARDRGTS